ncbi:capsular biosynthesis protein [Bacillaceae bacterium Marseille-Q3522]|nr:capsular biosynthesis protein [Bacillaceae bacterium Marseille-Q3522]
MNNIPQPKSINNMPKEINMKELVMVVKKRLWIIAIVMVLFSLLGFLYHMFFSTPLYQSSTRIIISADSEYRKTLQVIIKDKTIMEKVAAELQLPRSSEALSSQITVGSVDNSQVVSITAVDTDPQLAADIANTTARVFQTEVPNIVNFEDVQFLSEAEVNHFPINGNGSKIVITAIVAGAVIGIGLVFLLDSLDDSVSKEKDIEELLGVPVLGNLSKMKNRNFKNKKISKNELGIRGETVGYK